MNHVYSILVFRLLFLSFNHLKENREIGLLGITISIRIDFEFPREAVADKDVREYSLKRVFNLFIVFDYKLSFFEVRHNVALELWFFIIRDKFIRLSQFLIQFQVFYNWVELRD